MKVNHPVNFAIGIFCGVFFVFNILNDSDTFTLCLDAFATFGNIFIAFAD